MDVNSYKLKQIALADLKIELGIPLMLTLGGLFAAILVIVFHPFTWQDCLAYARQDFNSGFLVFFLAVVFLFYCLLPFFCCYILFGTHEFSVLPGGELRHRIYIFGIKTKERKYADIAKVDMFEGGKSVQKNWNRGRHVTATIISSPEIYVVVNRPRIKSFCLVKSHKYEALIPLRVFLQNTLFEQTEPQ